MHTDSPCTFHAVDSCTTHSSANAPPLCEKKATCAARQCDGDSSRTRVQSMRFTVTVSLEQARKLAHAHSHTLMHAQAHIPCPHSRCLPRSCAHPRDTTHIHLHTYTCSTLYTSTLTLRCHALTTQLSSTLVLIPRAPHHPRSELGPHIHNSDRAAPSDFEP